VKTLFKLSGAGNDFLALVEPESPPSPQRIAAWCRRGVSLGADGLFLLYRDGAPGEGTVARMVHFNADGGRSQLCVNGTRCAARLAFELGWARDHITIRTDAGDIPAHNFDPGVVELEPPPPEEEPASHPAMGPEGSWTAWYQRIGVPHLVIDWGEELSDCPVAEIGPGLRSLASLGAEGANVDFVHFVDPATLSIRTYERGVEGETLACGSGILAAVSCGVAAGRSRFPLTVTVASGAKLFVEGTIEGDQIESWVLRGDARLVGRIEALPAAEATFGDPGW
jgi:diaminopimelate epimerase